MKWIEVLDPKGLNGHDYGEVFACPHFAALALVQSGRAAFAEAPGLPEDIDEYTSDEPEYEEPTAEEPPGDLRDALEESTVAELKDMLRERDLKVSGNKAELIDRLLASEPDNSEEE